MTWRIPLLKYTRQDYLDQVYYFYLQSRRDYFVNLKRKIETLNFFTDEDIDEIIQFYKLDDPLREDLFEYESKDEET